MQTSTPAPRLALVAVLLAALPLAACDVGNSANRLTLERHVSIGQELIDLQRAHESGAIDAEEYARAKQSVLAAAQAMEVFAETSSAAAPPSTTRASGD